MPSRTHPAARAALNHTIAQRAAAQGLSLLELSRRSGLSYERLVRGRPLDDADLAALESVLGPLGNWRELSEVADQIIREVFQPSHPTAPPEIPPPAQEN